jgi:hypothetical protein
VGLVGAALAGAAIGPRRAPDPPAADLEIARAGQWLRINAGGNALVAAPGLLAAYHADARYAPLPEGSYEEILDALVRGGVDYLVVDSEVLSGMGSGIAPLSLDKPVAWHETRVRPVYVRIRGRDRNTLVFRVVRPGGPEPFSGEEAMKKAVGPMNHTEDHHLHGVLAERSGAYWVAAGEYALAVAVDELDAASRAGVARTLLLAGRDYERAEENARAATILEETNPEHVALLVEVLRRQGKDEEARSWEARLLELRGQRPTSAP